MDIKKRILSVGLILVLIAVLSLVGVWAVADLDFAVGSGGENMFTDCSSYLVIYVPMGSVYAYKVAINWRDYSSKIQGKDF